MMQNYRFHRMCRILLLIGLPLILLAFGVFFTIYEKDAFRVETLSDNWRAAFREDVRQDISVEDLRREFPNADNEEPGVLTLSRTLEDYREEKGGIQSPAILLDLYYTGAEVYVNQTLIGRIEMKRIEDGRTPNSRYAFVSLPQDCVGSTLSIRYYFDGKGAQTKITPPMYGDMTDLYFTLLLENLYPLTIGIFLVVFGIYFLIISVSVSVLIPELMGQIVSAVLSIVFGVWVFGTFRIAFLFMRSEYPSTVTYVLFMQFLPLLYLLLMQVHPVKHRKLFYGLFIITTILSEAMALCHMTGLSHLSRMRIVTYVLSVIFMLFLLYTDFEDIRNKNDDFLNILQMSGFTSAVVLAFSSMMIYLFTSFTRREPPSHLIYTVYATGCLFLVLTRYLIFLILLSRAEGQRVEFESLSRIANTDILTGVYNRIFCEDRFRWLDQSDQKNYTIVSLDVNHLKYVNDTFGHTKGDALLISFSEILKASFPETAWVCRVGGDEFAVILPDRYDSVQLDSFIEKMNSRLGKLDETDPVIPHSVAAGYAQKREMPERSAHEILLAADQRMYDNKRRYRQTQEISADTGLWEVPAAAPRAETAGREATFGTAADPGTIDSSDRVRMDSIFVTITSLVDEAYVYLRDLQHGYSRWSSEMVTYFGLPGEYMLEGDRVWEAHIHPEDRGYCRQNYVELLYGRIENFDIQYRALERQGRYVLCSSHGTTIRDGEGKPEFMVVTIRNHDLQDYTDPITGLRNQFGFTNDVTDAIRMKTPMRILLMDIAQFGQLNDLYGYAYGSRVLTEAGKYMRRETGDVGELYRMDGARFAILSRKYDEADMEALYRLLRENLKSQFTVDGRRQMIALNGGLITVDQFNVDATTVTNCLAYAIRESSMRHNGNLVVFRNELTDQNRQSIERLHRIRDCIEDNYRGFYLCYQYLVDARTEKVYGAEALLRWRDEENRTIPPLDFISVLEQDPMYPNLGAFILRQAMTDGNRFLAHYPDFVMNVNLSYTQIEKSDFAAVVRNALAQTGFPADHLCFELTESCRILEIDVLRNIVSLFKSLGVRFALDDFGTGYSSLDLLRLIPFDVIKLDRQFILDIEHDDRQAKTVEMVSSLAKAYGCRICVEGVETTAVRDILRKYDVDIIQGFLYAMPREAEILLASITSEKDLNEK